MRNRSTTLIAVLACSLTLSGCVAGATPRASLTPSTTPISVFATDEEATAAAIAAYQRYLDVSNQIAQEGGIDPDRIKAVATGETARTEIQGSQDLRNSGLHRSGSITFDSARFQQRWPATDGEHVVLYLCLDVTQSRRLDADGDDETPDRTLERVPLEVELVAVQSQQTYVQAGSVWPGESFC
jgi:hypothetical protein